MMKSRAVNVLILLLVSGVFVYGRDKKPKVETVTGAVVAYNHFSSLLPCYHICGGSLIVRLGDSGGATPSYIRVDFTYPDRMFPKGIVKGKKTFRLKLTRTSEHDAPLREFVPLGDVRTGKEMPSELREWELLPGAMARGCRLVKRYLHTL